MGEIDFGREISNACVSAERSEHFAFVAVADLGISDPWCTIRILNT